MEERPSKLARLQGLRSRIPFVSQSGLAALLREAQREDFPEVVSRRSIARARDQAVKIVTPYGTLHQTMPLDMNDGKVVDVEVQHPFAMLYHVCSTSAKYAVFICRALTAKPCSVVSPWTIVLYTDEILPGNQMNYKGARKMWGFYWAILELGSEALSDEDPGARFKTLSGCFVYNVVASIC